MNPHAVFDKKDLVKIYNGKLKAFVLYGNMIFFIVNFSSCFYQPLMVIVYKCHQWLKLKALLSWEVDV